MATYRRSVVTEPDATGTATRYDRATERRWALDASDIIALIAGLFYVVIGLLALVKLGIDGFPSEATTEVVGLTHTQLWGVISMVLGLLLLGGVGGYGRSLTTFAAAVLLVVGIVVVAAVDQLDAVLATDAAYGWTAIVIGAIVLIAAIAVPTVAAHSERTVDY